jgi:uncharacterized membrane protein YkvA (DUF1232 family)
MKRAPHIRLVDEIDSVGPEDVASVRERFAEEFAKVRPFLRGGKLAAVRKLARDVASLFELLVDPSFSIPWRTTAAVVFGLAYFLCSFDAIPDVIPVLGFLDDAMVVAEVLYLISDDLKRYQAHRARKDAKGSASPGALGTDTDTDAAPASVDRLVA